MFKRLVLGTCLLLTAFALPVRVLAAASEGGAQAVSVEGGAEKQPPLFPGSAEDIKTLLPTAVWVLIIFVALLVLLYKYAWKNVMAGLKAREDRIRKDIADAEAARQKAEAALAQYTQQLADAEGRVREVIARGQQDAEKIATGVRMNAQAEAEEIKERAMKEIEQAKNDALTQVYEQTANLATSIAEKIIRRNLNPDDQRELVNQSLEQLNAVGK